MAITKVKSNKINPKFKYLTPKKVYNVLNDNLDGSFTITNDFGTTSHCLQQGCAHLDGNDWIIVSKTN